ncbi:MAG TPA: hypothetical protein VM933_09255 [Acidimicrobiales bacterium]|nr:hypothetical protein [Acidimicrobiales bacterium]
MGVVVLIVLAAVWAAFLLPPILRARAEHRPSGSISDFRKQLHVLARTSPAATGRLPVTAGGRVVPMHPRPIAPPHRSPAPLRLGRSRQSVKRRRDIFLGLLVAMAGSLVLGVLPPLRALWAVHVLLDVLFAAYVASLVYLRNLAVERELKVRFLPPAISPAEPALLYRRSAN